jgi:hypothetical protein
MNPSDLMSGETVTELPLDFGRHNMFAFGRDTVFLSHLPMFMSPHDAQLILQVTLENADGGSLAEVWASERDDHPEERVYTMMPEKFALSTLYAEDPPERTSFRATFFRGHLERGGEPVADLTDVVVRIVDVVYARRFDPRSALDDLTYLLLGGADELFLAHVITRPPDFDQILAVEVSGPQLDEDDRRAGISVAFPGRANTAEARLRNDESATARGHVTGAHQFLALELDHVRELYFEQGELSTSRGAFESTPLETEAGFGDR